MTGIHGTKVCQLCGELGSYRGLASAQGNHWLGEFVCLWHHHLEPDDSSYGSSEFAALRRLLAKAPDRFCEVCLQRVPRKQARRVGFYWLCPECSEDDLDDLPERRYRRLTAAEARRHRGPRR